MEGSYEIIMGEKTVGTVQVTKQGLYYCFCCRCRLSGEVMCRITVTCGGQTQSLGLPVPEGDEFVLRTRLPAKRLGQGTLKFRAVPKHRQVGGRFVPISPEEPFRYLSRLENAVLQKQNGEIGIWLPEAATELTPDLPGSDQNL